MTFHCALGNLCHRLSQTGKAGERGENADELTWYFASAHMKRTKNKREKGDPLRIPFRRLSCNLAFYPAFSSRQSDRSRRSTISRVISRSRTRLELGRWYIRSSINSSRIIRRPRAPTLRARASLVSTPAATTEKCKRTFSYSNSRW